MTINIIVALGSDRAIGRQGDLAFHIRADLRHFKELTMGHPVIMGRRTFESLPKGALPGRRNIVITSRADYTAPGIETATSLEDAIALVADVPKTFIIGGASVYREALPMASELNLTLIDSTCPDADTYFPEWDNGEWELIRVTEPAIDPVSGLSYVFADYQRNIEYLI